MKFMVAKILLQLDTDAMPSTFDAVVAIFIQFVGPEQRRALNQLMLRALKPGGLLYAQTPAYPNSAAFTDPTHVNIITESTHEYFTRPRLTARQYGFKGDFAVRRIIWTRPAQVYEPLHPSWAQRVRQHLRQRRGACTHLIWELEACK